MALELVLLHLVVEEAVLQETLVVKPLWLVLLGEVVVELPQAVPALTFTKQGVREILALTHL